MLRTIFFIIKLGLLTTLVVWLAEQKGTADITWLGYDIQMHIGLFLFVVVAIILVAIFIYNVIDSFVTFPAIWKRYREVKSFENGYRAVTIGLTAVAAGDTKLAGKQAKKARKLMPNDTGLPLLLEAQAARLDGREDDAQQTFAAMLENKDTAFLGVRGLLQSHIDREDYTKALHIAQHALKTHPKQPWILKTVYDLEIKNENWDAALKILKKLEKTDALKKDQALSDRALLFLVQALKAEDAGFNTQAVTFYKKALRIREDLLPAAIALGKLYLRTKNTRAAKSLIEKTWKTITHPELGALWMDVMPKKKADNKKQRMQTANSLIKINPRSIDSYLLVAQENIDQSLWGPARDILKEALNIEPDMRVYDMLERLEISLGDFAAAKKLRTAMADPILLAPCWICGETGRICLQWHWFSEPHKLFGTIVWDRPNSMMSSPALLAENDDTPGGSRDETVTLIQH